MSEGDDKGGGAGFVPVVNVADAPEQGELENGQWGGFYRVMTPGMRGAGGKLGVAWNRVPPGYTGCPFHAHHLEDEVFYVLSGRGVLRYGDDLHDLRAGDCVSCPAGTGKAHQLANTSPDEDLVYLSIGPREPNEVCTYPDTGKVFVRKLGVIGHLAGTEYMDGEPDRPRIFDLAAERGGGGG
ncbi:MAG: cupin domain-containing protein [Deltaproteobacteria bacterium]|nr:cupin domain-containing protein [Deltaproteobacteria bacterium]